MIHIARLIDAVVIVLAALGAWDIGYLAILALHKYLGI